MGSHILTLSVSVVIFVAVLVVLRLAAIATAALLAAAVVAAPVLLVCAVPGFGGRRSALEQRDAADDFVTSKIAPLVYFGRPTLASAATAHMAPAELRTEAFYSA